MELTKGFRESIALNARNLHVDAQCLSTAGSHQRAASLSILAIEEVGKYLLYKWFDPSEDRPFRRNWLSHKRKQFAAFAVIFGHVQQQTMIAVAQGLAPNDWPKVRADTDWEKTQIFISEAYDISQNHPLEAVRNAAVGVLNLISSAVTAAIRNHPIACLGNLAKKGEIDKIKQAGFYIDPPTEDGGADFQGYSERQARFWLDLTEVALGALESNERCLELADKFATQHHVLPPPSTGRPEWSAAQWRDYLERQRKIDSLANEKIFELKNAKPQGG